MTPPYGWARRDVPAGAQPVRPFSVGVRVLVEWPTAAFDAGALPGAVVWVPPRLEEVTVVKLLRFGRVLVASRSGDRTRVDEQLLRPWTEPVGHDRFEQGSVPD